MLSEVQRKHNLVLTLYMSAETEASARYYQRLAYKYYDLVGKELENERLSHQGIAPSFVPNEGRI